MERRDMRSLVFLWTAIVCLVLAAANEEPSVRVIGLVEGSARLPCDVDVSNCGRVYFITWTKNISGEWVRLYLYSDQYEKPLQQLAKPDDRADFHLESNTAYLQIQPIRIEDDGAYKCDVTYVEGKCPSLSFATLVTYAPPSTPVIEKDGKMSINGSTVGPFYEGAALNLECETYGGKPAPEVSWYKIYKGATELTSESEAKPEPSGASRVTSTVKVGLGREDLGARIECHVINEAIDQPLVSWVEVDLHVGPLSLEVEGPKSPVTAGDYVTFTCKIEGAKPAANATWFNRSDVLHIQPHTQIDLASDGTFTTTSTVEVPVSRHDHQGTYYCKGSNTVLQSKGEAPLLKSIDVQVRFPPAITMQPNSVIVNESDNAIVYCTYEANPFNTSDVVWFHKGRALAVPTPGKYEVSSQGYPTLTVRNVRKEDAGNYSCALSNAVGRGNATSYAEINVMFPPVMEAMIAPEDVKEGGSVSLFCNMMEGNPLNLLRVRWYKGEELIHETTQREISWMGITRNSSGRYSCDGENKAGWGNRSEEKELLVQYLPGAAVMQELDPPAIKGETSFLTCFVEHLGLPPASVYRWERDGELLATTGGENYTTDMLRVGSKGNYSCAAVNEVGVGPKGFKYLSVYAPPTFIHDLPDIRGAARDAPFISFECRVECEPLCDVFWLKDGSRVSNSELFIVRGRPMPEEAASNQFRSVSSTLQFNMTAWPGRRLQRERDRANYTCVSTPNAVGEPVSSSMQFLVEYPPEQMSLSDSVVEVHEGEVPPPVECSASAWPPPTYLWVRGDHVVARDDTLAFNDSATRERDGQYVCVAENTHGRARIEMRLQVLYKPECMISESSNEAGSPVLVCRADGYPTKINFTWSKDNETLDDDYDQQEDDDDRDDRSVYVLPDSAAERFGFYRCVAINDIGESDPCEFLVSGPGLAGWHAEFGDKNVLVIAAIIGSIAILCVLAIIIIILIMRRRRSAGFGSPGKTPLGVGGDSLYQNVSTTPSDPKQNGPSAPESEGNTMYENMPFHRQGPVPSFPSASRMRQSLPANFSRAYQNVLYCRQRPADGWQPPCPQHGPPESPEWAEVVPPVPHHRENGGSTQKCPSSVIYADLTHSFQQPPPVSKQLTKYASLKFTAEAAKALQAGQQ